MRFMLRSVRRDWVTLGYIAAAAMNIGGVLIFSRAFTNPVINAADPVVMSNFGLLMIVVWGLLYLAAGLSDGRLKWISGALAIEKLVYVVVWVRWQLAASPSLAEVFADDRSAGVFYTIYGINDIVFMLFFAVVFLRGGRQDPGR